MSGQRGGVVVVGRGRDLRAGHAGEARFELDDETFRLTLAGTPLVAAYRDLATVAVQQGSVLLVLGRDDARLLIDGLGDRLGLLIGQLRQRRAAQLLADRFIELPADQAISLVEFRAQDDHGVAQLAYHAWGAALLPLDERQRWRLIRRAAIERVDADVSRGLVRVNATGRPPAALRDEFELAGLGEAAELHRGRLAGLRESALADAAAIAAGLLPDAPFGARQRAAGLLVDGRPADPMELGEAWPLVESAVLSEPTFAEAYRVLVDRGAGPRWLALAPRRPGTPEHMAWFFVALPGNLVAMEIVSSGAHATYLFRAMPRAAYRGQAASELGEAARTAVAEVSEALVDMRFLRQPIYLTDQQLSDPRHLRSRLAIAALPSLQAARARFVGRLIHRDEEGWQRSLDEAISWSASAGDDAARWQGDASDNDNEEDPTMEEGT
jgi:hypothetical protein